MANLLPPGHATSTMKPADLEEADMGGVARGLPVYEGSDRVKAGFIRKVYGILSVQLLFTALSSAFFMFHQPTRAWVLSNPNMLMTASILPFVFLLALFCHKDRHPLNMVLLGCFTACMTYTVGVVCAMYYASGYGLVVLQALILTAAVFISLTSYVMVTKKDFSWMGGALFAGLFILIIW